MSDCACDRITSSYCQRRYGSRAGSRNRRFARRRLPSRGHRFLQELLPSERLQGISPKSQPSAARDYCVATGCLDEHAYLDVLTARTATLTRPCRGGRFQPDCYRAYRLCRRHAFERLACDSRCMARWPQNQQIRSPSILLSSGFQTWSACFRRSPEWAFPRSPIVGQRCWA